jgi:hypothetical protein
LIAQIAERRARKVNVMKSYTSGEDIIPEFKRPSGRSRWRREE